MRFDACQKLCRCAGVLGQNQCEVLMSLLGATFVKRCRAPCIDGSELVVKVRLCIGALLDEISEVLNKAGLSMWLESETGDAAADLASDMIYTIHSGPWLYSPKVGQMRIAVRTARVGNTIRATADVVDITIAHSR